MGTSCILPLSATANTVCHAATKIPMGTGCILPPGAITNNVYHAAKASPMGTGSILSLSATIVARSGTLVNTCMLNKSSARMSVQGTAPRPALLAQDGRLIVTVGKCAASPASLRTTSFLRAASPTEVLGNPSTPGQTPRGKDDTVVGNPNSHHLNHLYTQLPDKPDEHPEDPEWWRFELGKMYGSADAITEQSY